MAEKDRPGDDVPGDDELLADAAAGDDVPDDDVDDAPVSRGGGTAVAERTKDDDSPKAKKGRRNGPFARLGGFFREVVGESLAELHVYEGPDELFAPNNDTAQSWTPPPPGTAVVVVSDLGRAARRRGQRRSRAAWQALLASMQEASCEPVVLVPGRSEHYAELDRALRYTLLLGWDRGARVARVAQFRKGQVR